jgi:hypothetical protein
LGLRDAERGEEGHCVENCAEKGGRGGWTMT